MQDATEANLEKLAAGIRFADTGCWEWTGSLTKGYGIQRFASHSTQFVHRVSYEMLVEPIPDGLHIDHLCRNPRCCNPDHLEPVTLAENNRRAAAAKTHCPSGHEYTEANTKMRRGKDGNSDYRVCRACKNERERRRHAERRSEGWRRIR